MRFLDLGAPELLLIVAVLVLVFGASKLGDIGGALGKSVREFKQTSQADAESVTSTATTVPDEPIAALPAPMTPAMSGAPFGDYRPAA